jgi:hypothetical protein
MSDAIVIGAAGALVVLAFVHDHRKTAHVLNMVPSNRSDGRRRFLSVRNIKLGAVQ